MTTRAYNGPGGTMATGRIEGYLHKLKSKVGVVGSAWNERWFKIEERGGDGGPELALVYYKSEKASSPAEAKAWVFLSKVTHVGLVDSVGQLSTRTSLESLDPRAVAALRKRKELCLEIQSTTKLFFLRAEHIRDLNLWVAGLQRLCGYDVTVPFPTVLSGLETPPYIRTLRQYGVVRAAIADMDYGADDGYVSGNGGGGPRRGGGRGHGSDAGSSTDASDGGDHRDRHHARRELVEDSRHTLYDDVMHSAATTAAYYGSSRGDAASSRQREVQGRGTTGGGGLPFTASSELMARFAGDPDATPPSDDEVLVRDRSGVRTDKHTCDASEDIFTDEEEEALATIPKSRRDVSSTSTASSASEFVRKCTRDAFISEAVGPTAGGGAGTGTAVAGGAAPSARASGEIAVIDGGRGGTPTLSPRRARSKPISSDDEPEGSDGKDADTKGVEDSPVANREGRSVAGAGLAFDIDEVLPVVEPARQPSFRLLKGSRPSSGSAESGDGRASATRSSAVEAGKGGHLSTTSPSRSTNRSEDEESTAAALRERIAARKRRLKGKGSAGGPERGGKENDERRSVPSTEAMRASILRVSNQSAPSKSAGSESKFGPGCEADEKWVDEDWDDDNDDDTGRDSRRGTDGAGAAARKGVAVSGRSSQRPGVGDPGVPADADWQEACWDDDDE